MFFFNFTTLYFYIGVILLKNWNMNALSKEITVEENLAYKAKTKATFYLNCIDL